VNGDRLLEAKVAIVTGGGTGIGRAVALALAGQAARVVVAGRRVALGEETVTAIRRAGGHAAFRPTDVTVPGDVAALVRFALDTFGRLDVAFNNAGYQEPRALLAEQPEAAFDTVFATNVKGIYLCMKHEITQMLAAGAA
jgi:NAD(P)-dependent dehydrogenase (short-subunit alcohol dehydrogenase family)